MMLCDGAEDGERQKSGVKRVVCLECRIVKMNSYKRKTETESL